MFTLDSKVVSLESAKADDNGPYIYKGTNTKSFYYESDKGAFVVHESEDTYYYNKRSGNKYTKIFVKPENVYVLIRRYRQSKFNPEFTNMIGTVRPILQHAIMDFYAVIYKWKEGSCNNRGNFLMPRHGNAKRPTVSPYYRQDPSLHKHIDGMIGDGMSSECIYSDLSHREATTVSQTIRDPKVISNRRYNAKHCGKSVDCEKGEEETEAQQIIKYVKEDDFIRTVTFTKDKYYTINVLPKMMKDIERFCLKKGGILSIDTTFEICDGLWLTDQIYRLSSMRVIQHMTIRVFQGRHFGTLEKIGNRLEDLLRNFLLKTHY